MTPNNETTVSPPRQNRPRVIRIEPSPGTLIALLLLFAGLWLLPRLMPVVLVLVAALTIVGTISPAVRWFEERHMRRGMGIAIVFSLLLVVAVLISHLTSPLAGLLRKVQSGDLVRMAASNAYEYSTRAIAICAYILSSVFLALY